jgi:hypothetical protein
MKKILLIVLLFFSVKILIGQNDSTKITAAEADTLNVKKGRFYKLFVERSNHEIRHLYKINMSPLIIHRPTIAFEQKIGKNFSSETSISYEKHAWLFFVGDLFVMDERKYPSYPNGFSFRGYQMIKYYHNLNTRRILGKNTNGFAGNYFAAQLLVIYANSGNQRNYDGTPLRKENYYFTYCGLSYGFQRRIGNIGYFEPSIFLDILCKSDFENPPFFNLGAKFKMGFAIESINSLGKMLKK